MENNLNEIVFDNFKSIFTKGNILRMKNNARVILQSKSLGNFFQYLKNLMKVLKIIYLIKKIVL